MKNSTIQKQGMNCFEKKTEILEKKFHKLLPSVPFKTEMAWCGTFSTTKDWTSFYWNMARERNIYFFDLGYGGNGITFSMIGAQIIRNTYKE